MPLTSVIHSPTAAPVVKPFTFPGLFRSIESGSLWLADSPQRAIRLSPAVYYDPTKNDGFVGESMAGLIETYRIAGIPFDGITPRCYQQVTTPVTLTFNP